jgi:hypothetical protein
MIEGRVGKAKHEKYLYFWTRALFRVHCALLENLRVVELDTSMMLVTVNYNEQFKVNALASPMLLANISQYKAKRKVP